MPARFAKITPDFNKDYDAVIVGAQGCHQGGYERAKQLHPKHLSKIGKYGAQCRWK